MTSELVIDVKENEISIALLEDKSLVEYQSEPRSASFSVGNIYIATVKKTMPGLNASFVDVGYERDAFLHYLDLGNQYSSFEKYLKQIQSDRKKDFPFEYKISENIALLLKKNIGIVVPENEIGYIALHLYKLNHSKK